MEQSIGQTPAGEKAQVGLGEVSAHVRLSGLQNCGCSPKFEQTPGRGVSLFFLKAPVLVWHAGGKPSFFACLQAAQRTGSVSDSSGSPHRCGENLTWCFARSSQQNSSRSPFFQRFWACGECAWEHLGVLLPFQEKMCGKLSEAAVILWHVWGQESHTAQVTVKDR